MNARKQAVAAARRPAPRAVVAFDHRWLLDRMAADAGVPAEARHGVVAGLKSAVYEAVETVADTYPDADAMLGVLVDEQTAGSVALLAKKRALPVALAVERNEAAEFTLEYGEDWTHHIAAYAPDYAKVLFRWNEAGPAQDASLRRLESVSAWCRSAEQAVLLELILPAGAGDHVLVDAVHRLVEHGMAPALWKLPVPASEKCIGQLVSATRSAPGRPGGVLFLGGGRDSGTVMKALSRCMGVEGVTGWAVGRALWAQPLEGLLARRLTRPEAVDLVVRQLLEFLALLPPQSREFDDESGARGG